MVGVYVVHKRNGVEKYFTPLKTFGNMHQQHLLSAAVVEDAVCRVLGLHSTVFFPPSFITIFYYISFHTCDVQWCGILVFGILQTWPSRPLHTSPHRQF